MSHRKTLCLLALAAAPGSLLAQNVYLTEDFNAGLMPPTGWVEGNNGNSLGWEIEYSGGGVLNSSDHAFHDDFTGYNDNYLMSPQVDLTSATQVYAWCEQGITFASWRDHHYVDVSLDNGVTFVNLVDDLSADGWSHLNVDLGAYAGTNGVNIAYRYTGDYASEWELDNVVIDDVGAPPPPPAWPNLPTAFQSANGYSDDFESYAGVVPSHMATNALDAGSGLPDLEAWCSIDGGSGYGANSGAYCLEMGLDPLSNNYHDVRNGLIIGLNGAGVAGLLADFAYIDHGEESDTWDGVWVSDDGLVWNQASGSWVGTAGAWSSHAQVDLAASGAAMSGDFYLLFAQDDNFPYGYLDGIGIDDIVLSHTGPSGPVLAVSNLVAGGITTISVSNATPGSLVRHGYSLTGAGPVATPYGDLLLSPPYVELPAMQVDPNGDGALAAPVPPIAAGVTVWLHALDLGSLTFTNGLMEVIQ